MHQAGSVSSLCFLHSVIFPKLLQIRGHHAKSPLLVKIPTLGAGPSLLKPDLILAQLNNITKDGV